jgi:hypothetical protein
VGALGGSSPGLPGTDQLVEILVLICNLGQHPLPEQAKELLELHPLKQVEEGGIARCLGQLQIQSRAERLVMPLLLQRSLRLGKALQIPGAAAPTENAKDGHQQQQPLGITDTSTLATFRQGLQKGDQISTGRRLGQGTGAVPTKPAPAWPYQLPCA